MATQIHPLVLRAREALARGDFRSAETAAEERLKTAGRDVNALQVRCNAQQRRGQFGEAARTLQTVIGIDSHADWAYGELIQLLVTHGKLTDAEQVARAGIRANPDNANSHNAFGRILTQLHDLPSGEWHLRRALALGQAEGERSNSALVNLATNLMLQGRTQEADENFARARESGPVDEAAVADWSALRARRVPQDAADEELLAKLDAARNLTGHELLSRGRLYDRRGEHARAWQDFVAGKRKIASVGAELQYKADAVEALFGRFQRFFTRENLERAPEARVRADVPQPVFIMGFPRSGAALVERIIGSHAAILAGGELPFLGELRKLATDQLPDPQPFPENLAQSWTADRHYTATLFRDYYLARAEHSGLTRSGKTFFTDRMPFNELYLPLLRMAFPQAKVIHVVRHPLDVCVSVMANDMTHGFNCGYRVEDVAHHLNAVSDLVAHYRTQMDSSDYVIRYESLVAAPAAETQQLMEYLGLPLQQAQIDVPINGSSVGRHLQQVDALQPYCSRLQKLMAAHGYS